MNEQIHYQLPLLWKSEGKIKQASKLLLSKEELFTLVLKLLIQIPIVSKHAGCM